MDMVLQFWQFSSKAKEKSILNHGISSLQYCLSTIYVFSCSRFYLGTLFLFCHLFFNVQVWPSYHLSQDFPICLTTYIYCRIHLLVWPSCTLIIIFLFSLFLAHAVHYYAVWPPCTFIVELSYFHFCWPCSPLLPYLSDRPVHLL
jgi:hypothetical protein